MDFLSIAFYIFLPVFFAAYYLVKAEYRYIIILAGSYIFYGYGNPSLLIFLLATTVITYFAGLLIAKYPQRKILVTAFLLNILILLVFKYTNFAIGNLNFIAKRLGGIFTLSKKNWILPVGLSFYIFQSCTYLTDVYRKKIRAEKNPLLYASFVSFFPTILSGPIQKSRELLPQLKNPGKFDYIEAKKGTILFIWGLFEKIMIANNLMTVVNKIYGDISSYGRIYHLLAAVSFSLYIYADFSSYSDMARGISKIMGISITRNFNNPYLSVSTSEFWNRWHVSLNDWFRENIYIPLGGNRKGTLRKYINVLVVFFVSGLWHGAQWHFVAWGVINGLLVVIGTMLMPLKRKIYGMARIDESAESIVFLKRAGVFILITFTWIFFQNGIYDSLNIINSIIHIKPIDFFDPNLLNVSGTAVTTFVTMIAVVLFCTIQIKRQKEAYYFEKFNKQPEVFQVMLLAVLVVVCIFSAYLPSAEVNTGFLYFQF